MAERTIKKQSIIPRLDGIQHDIAKLKELGELPVHEFSNEDSFIRAQFYLRRALEGVFNIGTHILSRIPGGRVSEYKQIALKLGELGIVDEQFANGHLKAMAGYRNRLTHFYSDIRPEEIYQIIQEYLPDFDTFCVSVQRLISNPERFQLTIE
ncbi:DUF86 domain-containing protein [bacterium]|nr:DUF86 domain-containing protein [bacterium]